MNGHLTWAELFARSVAELFDESDPGRVLRGLKLADSARGVGKLEVATGEVRTSVAGSRGGRYSVRVGFPDPGDPESIEYSCDCPDWDWICKHAVAVLAVLTGEAADDPSIVRRLGAGPAYSADEGAEVPEGAGATRWAAEAYEDGPSAAEAFARVPAAPPEAPPLPEAPEHPCFHSDPFDQGRFTEEIDADGLDLQAAIAANSAFGALDAADRGLGVHLRPDDLGLDAARIASSTAGLAPELARAAGCSQAEMEDRARAWAWAGADGVAVMTAWWKPEPAVREAADRQLAELFGQVNRRLNRWTVPSRNLQLRLAEDGRWHPYTKSGDRWAPAGPPSADPEAAARALDDQAEAKSSGFGTSNGSA